MDNKKINDEVGPYLKKLVGVSAFIFVATIVSKLATYGYKIVIARYFGTETYGLFSLALIVIGIASAIAALGLNDGIVRYVSFYRGTRDFSNITKLVKSSKRIVLFTSIISTIALVLISPLISRSIFHNEEFTPLIAGMGLSLPFILMAGVYLAIIRGFEKIKVYSFLINIYQNITRLVLILVLVIAGFGVISITLSYLLTFVGLALLSYYYSNKEIKSLPIKNEKYSKKIMPELISYSWPLLFVGILYNVFYWSDSIILGYFTDANRVGIYNAAVTLVSLFGIAPDLFMQFLFPLISFKLSENKKDLVRNLIRQVTKWIYLINIPLFIFLFLFPEQGILILFGSEYLDSTQPLKILSLGALFLNMVGLSSNLISIKGRTKLTLLNFAIFTLINIILDLVLIPKYGIVGAATATLVTAIAFSICIYLQTRKIYGFNVLANYSLKILFMGAIIFFIGILINNRISSFMGAVIFCIIALVFYLISLNFIRAFDENDKDIIRAIFRKIGLKKLK